jgi:hypothetical protein
MNLEQLDSLPGIPWKYKLAYLVYQFSKLDQVECPVKHSFKGDEYIREMFIPAGALFIGRTHTNGHLVRLVSGTVVNISEYSREEISAPFEFHSAPGYQAVFQAVTDVIGETVHKNPDGIRDVQALEDRDFEQVQHLITRGKMIETKLLEGNICLE